MNYYHILSDDSAYADRWFLGEPLADAGSQLDAREFRYGQPYSGPAPRIVPVEGAGRRVAFNLAAFDMPVVSSEIADILEQLAPLDIQRYRVVVDSDICGYEILNLVSQERCVDEARSNVRKWGPEDGRPDKVGHYREFDPLVVDAQRTHGRHLFRIWGSLVELIVSGDVRDAISSVPDLGVVFQLVSR